MSTVTLAPARPPAASLTICGSWAISSWSSATRLLDAAASAAILVRSASAMAMIFTLLGLGLGGLDHLGDQLLLAQLGLVLGQLGLRGDDRALRLGLRQRAGLGRLGLRLVDLGLVLRLDDGGLPGELGLLARPTPARASADAWSACAWAILACRWIAALFGAAIAAM